jgi:hypothetical protein
MKDIFFGFICGVVLCSWGIWFTYIEQRESNKQLQIQLKEKSDLITQKNIELINLYNYIILLEKNPVRPAPAWAEYQHNNR